MFKAEVDMREWGRAINRVHGFFKDKELSQFINRSAGSIALKALVNTDKASGKKIKEKYLANPKFSSYDIVYKRGKKKGQVRKTITAWIPSRITAMIFQKHHKELRKTDPIEWQRKMNKWAWARVLATSFLRSGWLPAIDAFRQYMKGMKQDLDKKSKKRRKQHQGREQGTAVVAPTGTITPEAALFNRTVIENEKIRPHLNSALLRAVREETRLLKKQADDMIAKNLRKAGVI